MKNLSRFFKLIIIVFAVFGMVATISIFAVMLFPDDNNSDESNTYTDQNVAEGESLSNKDNEIFTEEEKQFNRISLTVESLRQQYEEWITSGTSGLPDETEFVKLSEFLYEPELESGYNKMFYSGGQVSLSNYYNYGYANVKDNYQSFRLIDYEGNTVYVYGNRSSETTKELIADINAGEDEFYLLLTEYNGVDKGGQYMTQLSVYANPLMSND